MYNFQPFVALFSLRELKKGKMYMRIAAVFQQFCERTAFEQTY